MEIIAVIYPNLVWVSVDVIKPNVEIESTRINSKGFLFFIIYLPKARLTPAKLDVTTFGVVIADDGIVGVVVVLELTAAVVVVASNSAT